MSEATDREILLEMRGDLKTVMAEVRKTNGRVTALESWRHSLELAQAREDGVKAASSGVILTTKQVAMIGGLLSVVATVAGFLSRYAG